MTLVRTKASSARKSADSVDVSLLDNRVPIEAALGIKNGDCGVLRNAGLKPLNESYAASAACVGLP